MTDREAIYSVDEPMTVGAAIGITAVIVIAVVALSVAVNPRSSAERDIENTVNAFWDGLSDNDGRSACAVLSREAQAQLMRRQDAASCARAAQLTRSKDVLFFDFGATRFGPDKKWARVPSSFEGEDFPRGLTMTFRPIPLEHGDGRWRITKLDWYFES